VINIRNVVTSRLLLSSLLPLMLAGCLDQNMRDLESFVVEVKSHKAGHIEPVPEIQQIETFTYVSEGRRNPFQSVVDDAGSTDGVDEGNGLRPDLLRRKEELESYPLDSLRLVGFLEQLDTTWALIQTSEKTIYRVKAGNYLGQNHGHITLVTEQQIELTEIVSDGRGGYSERQASLALPEQE